MACGGSAQTLQPRATNPLPVVVPRHRVARSDSGMGGYLGGVEAKRTLLSLEAA